MDLPSVPGRGHNSDPMSSTSGVDPLQRVSSPAVLATGASGGIGRAISLAFGKAGWFVGIHYNKNKSVAESTLRAVETEGGSGNLYQADIREVRPIQEMIEQFCKDARGPYTFICNAGIAASNLLLKQKETEWNEVLATNLTGTFHCLKTMASPLIEQGGGAIIVIGSYAGYQGIAGQAAYAASKAGLIGLAKTAAQEWGQHNIRVNLLLPGWQKTGLSERSLPDDGWIDHALHRPPSIEEVAQTVFHLAQLQDVSGQIWNCDSRYL